MMRLHKRLGRAFIRRINMRTRTNCGAHRWGAWNDIVDNDPEDTKQVWIDEITEYIDIPRKGAAYYLVGKFRMCTNPGCGSMEERKIPRQLLRRD